jgi:lipopolysaccharide export system permease protein
MNILDKYLAKQVIMMILVVALALLGFDLFFNLVHELKVVGKGQYTLWTALAYLGLTIPGRLYAMFPWSALIGTLVCLGALANHSELVVMRTSAISVMRITWAVVKAAVILTIFVAFLGEGIAPTAERLAQNKRTLALSGGQTIQTAYGLWVRQGHDFIHVQTVRGNGELLGVTHYQFTPDRKLKAAIYAETAIKEGSSWRLQRVQGTEFQGNKTQTFHRAEQRVSTLLEPEILETTMVKHPERLSIPTLWRTIQHRVKNELSAQNYEVALWSKLLQPLVIIMMVVLAVPFVFGPLRSGSQGLRVVVGIFVAFLFHTLNGLFSPLAIVYQFPPVLAVLLPIMLFSGVGIWLLRRVR